ncbi:MAG: FAD-dependent oxidoreductase [bacterium]|nr:FAD-dependent oxidoreductase [bacterium]
MKQKMMDSQNYDIIIVGGGLGGCAAAIHAARNRMRVCLIEECTWIGGQITSQGVSALDEHEHIEQFGGTAAYYELRNGIRDYYRSNYKSSADAANSAEFNPGNCWVSRLAFEPKAGLKILYQMMQPSLDQQHLSIFTNTRVISASVREDKILDITIENLATHEKAIFAAEYFIDATELGDLLPMTGTQYVVGAESSNLTDEPHAHAGKGDPELVQSFTYTFAVEYCPGENHTIPKPDNYEFNRDHQPYSFITEKGIQYRMFGQANGTPGSFWTYRRLIDALQFGDPAVPNDIALINWHSNDFRGGSIIDVSPQERQQRLQQAKNLSLGFLFWLQTEAPRDDGGYCYPELKLRKDIMGTEDGLSQFPYIRESRRIKALQTIREQDISAEFQSGARSKNFDTSVGIGKYWIDLHRCSDADQGLFLETKPFQIPLGALIPIRMKNLIAGSKNIGTTHITNGAYRLHPVEWAIGEAAGALAVMAIKSNKSIHEIYDDPVILKKLQHHLVESGVPICWFIDVSLDHPAFAAVQWLAGLGITTPEAESLFFRPDSLLSKKDAMSWLGNANLIFTMMHEIKSSFIEKFVEQDEIPFSRAMFVQALANTLKAFF